MILVSLRIYTNELEKITYKSLHEQAYSGYPIDVRPGQYFWIPRLQLTQSYDGMAVYKPETQSILFKDYVPHCLYEYSFNKILVGT